MSLNLWRALKWHKYYTSYYVVYLSSIDFILKLCTVLGVFPTDAFLKSSNSKYRLRKFGNENQSYINKVIIVLSGRKTESIFIKYLKCKSLLYLRKMLFFLNLVSYFNITA